MDPLERLEELNQKYPPKTKEEIEREKNETLRKLKEAKDKAIESLRGAK